MKRHITTGIFTELGGHPLERGRETIDKIRDELGNEGFVAFCRGQVILYRETPIKVQDRWWWGFVTRWFSQPFRDFEEAQAKYEAMKMAHWYCQMAQHVEGADVSDPRAGDPGFRKYNRFNALGDILTDE